MTASAPVHSPLPHRVWDAASVIAVVVLAVTSSLRQEDIRFWDESLYLERGLTLGFGSQPGWEWNPLYTDMYWLLGRFFSDPIDLYFAGRASAAALLVLAVWWSLRLFTRPSIALAGGLVAAALPITYVWPGVSSPSAGFLLLALAIAWRWRSPGAYAAASAVVWLAAATRPEFVWPALIVTIVAAVSLTIAITKHRITTRAAAGAAAAIIAIPAILAIGYGNPTELGTRSWEAFEQHYELRFATEADDPWQIDADVVGRDFPGASSIPAAAATNPGAFATHVARNTITLPLSAGGHFLGLGGDSRTQNALGVATALVWVVSLALALIRPAVPIRETIRRIWRAITARSSRGALAITLITFAAALVSTFVIYPRPHYLTFLIGGLIIATGYLLDRLGNASWLRWFPSLLVALVGVATFIINVVALTDNQDSDKPFAASLRAMNTASTQWRILTPERPLDLYLTNGRQILEPGQDATTFTELLDANNVNAIFDGILVRQADYASLDGFEEFLANPEAFGFTSIIPESPFLIRQ